MSRGIDLPLTREFLFELGSQQLGSFSKLIKSYIPTLKIIGYRD